MLEFLQGISVTAWIAIYGAVLSTIAILLNINANRLDRGELKITGMIARKIPDKSKRSYLHFTIVNIGRRPITAQGLATKTNRKGKEYAIILCNNLPKKLQEGETAYEMFDKFDAIENFPFAIFVFDSIGKYHKMKKADIKRLYTDYRKHLNEEMNN